MLQGLGSVLVVLGVVGASVVMRWRAQGVRASAGPCVVVYCLFPCRCLLQLYEVGQRDAVGARRVLLGPLSSVASG